MAVREIRVFGDPILRTPCHTVDPRDPAVAAVVADLLDTVRLPGRAGVAAPQIGVGMRAFSYNVDGEIGYVLNPVLAEVSGEPRLVDEGCLSVPSLYFPRMRYPQARVTGVDLSGSPIEVNGTGILAQALQHETDHLDGKLYIEGLESETRREAMRAIRESAWF